jgi:hypothetical protein
LDINGKTIQEVDKNGIAKKMNLYASGKIKRLSTQSESKAINFLVIPKNDSCEQFYYFFDPMIYLFAARQFDKTRTLYFYSYYVCSLFSNQNFIYRNL